MNKSEREAEREGAVRYYASKREKGSAYAWKQKDRERGRERILLIPTVATDQTEIDRE